jgi:hypothetical protein
MLLVVKIVTFFFLQWIFPKRSHILQSSSLGPVHAFFGYGYV